MRLEFVSSAKQDVQAAQIQLVAPAASKVITTVGTTAHVDTALIVVLHVDIKVATAMHVLQDKMQSITIHHTLMIALLVEFKTVLNVIIWVCVLDAMLDSSQVIAV